MDDYTMGLSVTILLLICLSKTLLAIITAYGNFVLHFQDSISHHFLWKLVSKPSQAL
jgi:hypothetical protein